MPNCFDYLTWRGDVPFSVSPLNEVDGMLLARLSYAPFELVGKVKAEKTGRLCTALLEVENLSEHLVTGGDEELIRAISESSRFSDLYMFEYVNIIDSENETQFSAVTFELARGLYYVAFRGTDDTLVGWKEDFNMSFKSPVPAQEKAVQYFERLGRRLRGKFILGGHSKGGNLAIYAAAFASVKLQKRIIAIQNYDGPGFENHVLETEGFKNIKNRVNAYIPQSSVVGLLLYHGTEYTVVSSTNNGLLQHDTYSWEVDKTRFVSLERITESSRFLDSALKEWMEEMSPYQRERLIDTLYEIIGATGAETLTELSENRIENLFSVLKALGGLDREEKTIISEAVRKLSKGVKKVISDTVKSR